MEDKSSYHKVPIDDPPEDPEVHTDNFPEEIQVSSEADALERNEKTLSRKLSLNKEAFKESLDIQLRDKGFADCEETLSDSNLSCFLQEDADIEKVNVLLIYASYKGDENAVLNLLKKTNDSTPDYICNNLNALQVAIAYSHDDCVTKILGHQPQREKWLKSKINGYSLIHYAVYHNNPNIYIILDYLKSSNEPTFNETIINAKSEDALQYSALHIAAHEDLPDMVRALVEKGADMDAKLDDSDYTPLHIAALKRSTRAAERLIENGASLTATSKSSLTTMLMVSVNIPRAMDAITPMLNARIQLKEDEDDKELVLDFSNLQKAPNDFESSLLSCFVDCEKPEYLQHPLCQALLDTNWKRVLKWFILRIIYCTIMLTILNTYILAFHDGTCIPPEKWFDYTSIACPGNATLLEQVVNESNCWKIFINAVHFLVVPLTIIDIMRKIMGLLSFVKCFSLTSIVAGGIRYGKQIENYLEWFSLIATLLLFFTNHGTWHDILAPLIILSTWTNLMILMGQFPFFGVYVEMYQTVLKEFFKLLIAYVCLLIGYSISFSMIFKKQDPFSNPLKAIWKTMAMMIGELEYNDLFEQDDQGLHSFFVHLFFLSFLFTIVIIMMNLLIGIVVHDVNEIKKSALTTNLERKVILVRSLDTPLSNIIYLFDKLREKTHSNQPCNRTEENNNHNNTFKETHTVPQHKYFDSEPLREALKIAIKNRVKSNKGSANSLNRAINDLLNIFKMEDAASISRITTELRCLVKSNRSHKYVEHKIYNIEI